MGDTPPKCKPVKLSEYTNDVRAKIPDDPVWRERFARRERKIVENPEHHGVHLGGLNHCKWAAGIERFAIIYEILRVERTRVVRFLAVYEP